MQHIRNIPHFVFALAICLFCQSSFANEAATKLPYASPESQGVPTEAIISFMEELERNNLNMHSIMLLRNGNILAECYWPYFSADKKHRMYSVSKSFTAVAIGMMIDEGRISLDDKVAEFFPELLPADPHPYVRQATVRHLLTMSTFNPSTASGHDDWVKAFFHDPREKTEPGSRFRYDTSATNVLCGIVEKLKDKPILEYMRPVFDEIGIAEDIWCIRSPDGRSWTGSGIMCTTQDFAKFALLCLNMGEWKGKRLISREFMEAATTRQIDNGAQGYGYQFWVLREGGFSCNGMGGQFAFCLPSKNLIMITTADNQAVANYSNLIHEAFYRLAGKIEHDRLPENVDAQQTLQDKIANVSTPLPTGDTTTPHAAKVSGVRYTMEANPMGIQWMTVYITPEKCILVYENQTGTHSIILGMGEYIFQKFPEKYHGVQIGTNDSHFDTIAAAAWRDENTLSGMIYSIDDHLGSITLTMSFSDGKLQVTMRKVAEFFFNTYQGTAEGSVR